MNTRESAANLASFGISTVAAIRDALIESQPDDTTEIFVLSERIRLCNSQSNLWIGEDLHNKETGELYDGHGRFWACNSKLCPSCLAKISRRNRKQVKESLSLQKLRVGENLQLMTLTFPTTELPLLQTREIINLAWSFFRKRSWFKNTIIGGAKSEEFTINSKRFHYHIHALIRSKYISYHKFRAEWTECLQTAFLRLNIPFSIATSDSLAVANCKRITSLDTAINEVCKYITKSDSWQKLQTKDLLDICRIRRFPRMFELFGSFKIPVLPVASLDSEDIENKKTILDNEYLSDGQTVESGWRGQLRAVGVAEYLDKLHEQISDESNFRIEQLKFKFPFAKFRRFRDNSQPKIQEVIENLERMQKRCEFENGCNIRGFHQHAWNDGNGYRIYTHNPK